jgi:ABC-type glucose/galactose transport system permease subunit
MPTDAGGLNYAQTTLVGGNSLDNFARHFLGVSKVELKGTYFEQFKFQLDNLLLYGVIDTLLLYNLWRKIDLSVKMFPFSITSNAPALFSTRGKVKVYDIATTTELLKSGTIVNNNLLNDEFSVI